MGTVFAPKCGNRGRFLSLGRGYRRVWVLRGRIEIFLVECGVKRVLGSCGGANLGDGGENPHVDAEGSSECFRVCVGPFRFISVVLCEGRGVQS